MTKQKNIKTKKTKNREGARVEKIKNTKNQPRKNSVFPLIYGRKIRPPESEQPKREL